MMGQAESSSRYNVSVLGAAGGIGQPLSLLLASSKFVKKLNLYDVVPVVNGVAVDISHVNMPNVVTGFAGDLKNPSDTSALKAALTGADVVVIPAGVPRKPGMTRDDLFAINAGIVAGLVQGIAETCPKAMILIISNPVNSTVPIAAEILKKNRVYDPKRLFGVSTLDIVRAQKFIGDKINVDPRTVEIPVIGGHSGKTILPLLSQAKPAVSFSQSEVEALTDRIQNAGTEVVDAKAGGGSATLSMAHAGARFAESVMRGMSGESNVIECAFVPSEVQGLSYFASKVLLGKNGAEQVFPIGQLNAFEKTKLETEVLAELKANIDKGTHFGTNFVAKI